MPLSKAEVRQIGCLARVRLNETEVNKLSREPSLIPAYFIRLQELNTEGCEVHDQRGAKNDVLREHEVRRLSAKKDALTRALGSGGQHFYNPRVIV